MPRRVLKGKVVSDAAEKTIAVLVERRVKHPLYKKYLPVRKSIWRMMKIIRLHIGDIVSINRVCTHIEKKNLDA